MIQSPTSILAFDFLIPVLGSRISVSQCFFRTTYNAQPTTVFITAQQFGSTPKEFVTIPKGFVSAVKRLSRSLGFSDLVVYHTPLKSFLITSLTVVILLILYPIAPIKANPSSRFPFEAFKRASAIQYGASLTLHVFIQ
ncbi:MAG: hypothetical protein PWQ27_754 [Kosmotoga sp.]|nr:hypothetical protein [Kosmotoga sp.]MDK2953371.1 hypothetical protein [Kosmotoga sp.]